MPYLVLVRHGESKWNQQGLWTGWTDIELDEKGKEIGRKDGDFLKNIHFDISFTSKLKRAKQTLEEIKKVIGDIPTEESSALNERNYGIYTGKNKWEIEKQVGEEEFLKIRRGWNVPIENGETLKDVYERVILYYKEKILPEIKLEKNVLISAHGNSLRALVKFLENISDEQISNLELQTGEIYIYQMDSIGKIISKEIKKPA